MGQLFTNNARSVLVSGITAADTSLTIDAGAAYLFPTANTGLAAVSRDTNWFKLTLQNTLGDTEIIYVRTRADGSAAMSNILRGQEGTIARDFLAGSIASLRVTAQDFNVVADKAASGANSDITSLTGLTVPLFATGTRMPFAQAAAPTGWVQDTSDAATNRMLRVVNTAGGGVAGTHSPILNNVVPSHTHTATTSSESAEHTHTVSGTTSAAGGHNHTHQAAYHTSILYGSAGGYGAYGGGTPDDGASLLYTSTAGDHSHTWSGTTSGRSAAHTHSLTTNGGSSATNWEPRYIDMIICTKN